MKNSMIKVVRPDIRQFVINELYLIALLVIGGLCCGLDDMPWGDLPKVICLLLVSCRFTITGEQLIYERGVLSKRSDFIELYRVVDFKESRSFLQRFVGLKTVVIYSGDRTHPHLVMPGVHNRLPLVTIIRDRVEFNKQRKGIYEITNR